MSGLLDVRSLSISSRVDGNDRAIVTDASLALSEGETVGLVGESGSGKSMIARAICGLLPAGVHATGSVRYRDRDLLALRGRELARIRGAEIGLIFQDPFTMLNPLQRCGTHIVELLRDEHGRRLGRHERRAEAVRRLDEVGIGDPGVADAYPFELSGGMRQRVGIAAVLARDPKIVIADEPSTALDVTTQKEILARLRELQRSRGMALILITHDLRVAFSMCDRISVLYAGALLEQGDARAVEREPLHPYTLGLLLSEPPGGRRLSELPAIPGNVPTAATVAGCCAFAARCRWTEPECMSARPPLVEPAPGRETACVRVAEIAPAMRELRRTDEHDEMTEEEDAAAGPLVEVDGLVKRFGGGRSRRGVEALAGISVEIGLDDSVGLVGESGSGKSTLARCLLGLERPDGGRILVDGIDATDFAALSADDRRRVRATIQMVFQDPYSTLNPVRTIEATLREALLVRDSRRRDVRGRVRDLLGRVGLSEHHAGRKPAALSGGERQRVAIARALAGEPRLIVCDEAVSALDVSVQAQIINLLNALRRELGVSYLFITHDLAVVRQVARRIYVLRRGEIVESGIADAVLDRPRHPYTQELVASIPGHDDARL